MECGVVYISLSLSRSLSLTHTHSLAHSLSLSLSRALSLSLSRSLPQVVVHGAALVLVMEPMTRVLGWSQGVGVF